MRRLLLLFLAFLFSLQSVAQDPDLLGYWFLTDLVIDGQEYIPPSNDEVEYVALSFMATGPDNFVTFVCDVLSADVTYHQNNVEFTLENLINTLGGCDMYVEDSFYQGLYFNFYYENNTNSFTYAITNENDGRKTLVIEGINGDTAIYTDQFFHQYIFNTWFLNYLIIDDEYVFVPQNSESFNPSVIFIETLITSQGDYSGDSGCNLFDGNMSYNASNRELTLLSNTISNNNCSVNENTIFEGLYRDFLLENQPQTFSYILYIIKGVRILTLGNQDGNWAVYGDELLSITDFSLNKVTIYPNPVSTKLNISSKNTLIENITVYSVLGEKVMELTAKGINSIDVSSLSEGLYFLEINTPEGRNIQKFIKK